jgi:hypothetical protein
VNSTPRQYTQLQVPVRGTRDYVHGTDVFTLFQHCLALESIFKIKALELKFTAPVTGCFDVEVSDSKTDAFQASPAQMWIKDDQEIRFVYIVPNQAEVVRLDNSRETRLSSQVSATGKIYSIAQQSSFSTIEKMVFINKAMLLELAASVPEWFFGRLRLSDFNFETAYDVSLELSTIAGTGLASSDIYLDAKVSGDIVFLPRY